MRYNRYYVVACPHCAAPIGKACWMATTFEKHNVKKWMPPHRARKRLVDQQPKTFAGHVVTNADSNA